MKKTKILYWVFTGLFAVMMVGSAIPDVFLVPGFPGVKEWAYAGLFFDLIGATYSIILSGGNAGQWGFMILPIALGALSYLYYKKKLNSITLNLQSTSI